MLKMVTCYQFQHSKELKTEHGNKALLNTKNVVLQHLYLNGNLKTVYSVTNVHTFVLTLVFVRSFWIRKNKKKLASLL